MPQLYLSPTYEGPTPSYPAPVLPYAVRLTAEYQKIPLLPSVDTNSVAIRNQMSAGAQTARYGIQQAARIYDASVNDSLYTCYRNNAVVLFNGQPLRWRVPASVVASASTDLVIQDEFGITGFPSQSRLRASQPVVTHDAMRIDASDYSIHRYSPSDGAVFPTLFSTAPAPGSGREWIGLIRPEMVAWGLENGGTVASPDIPALKAALPMRLRASFATYFMASTFRAPAIMTDAAIHGSSFPPSGQLEMGSVIRLDHTITDNDILGRVPGTAPVGSLPSGMTYADAWRMVLWMILFSLRDYGMTVAASFPSTSPLWNLQFEDDATEWEDIIGPMVSGSYSEIIRSFYNNSTSGNTVTRPSNSGIPMEQLVVLGTGATGGGTSPGGGTGGTQTVPITPTVVIKPDSIITPDGIITPA